MDVHVLSRGFELLDSAPFRFKRQLTAQEISARLDVYLLALAGERISAEGFREACLLCIRELDEFPTPHQLLDRLARVKAPRPQQFTALPPAERAAENLEIAAAWKARIRQIIHAARGPLAEDLGQAVAEIGPEGRVR